MIQTIVRRSWAEEIERLVPENMRIGTEFIVLESFEIPKHMKDAFRVEGYTTVIIAEKGKAKFMIDMKEYQVKAPFIFTIMSGKIIHHQYISPDYSSTILVAANTFYSEILNNNALSRSLAMFVNDLPVMELNDVSQMATNEYLRLLKNAVKDVDNPMRLEVVKHLTLAMYYGYGNRFLITAEKKNVSRNDDIMDQFISLVEKFHKKERGLKFYADKMCLTPKYISSVVNKISGKTASQWIDEAVILEAKALLNCTNMTVQQITNELNFPDQSTFGKYFKNITGLSPKDYRSKTPR